MGLGFSMWFPLGKDKKKTKKHYKEFFKNLPSTLPNREVISFFDVEGFRVKVVP